MFCEHCGAKLEDGAKFCTACGARVEPLAPGGNGTGVGPEPGDGSGDSEAPKKRRRRWPIVLLVVIVLLIAAAAGAYLYLSSTGFTFPWQQEEEVEEEEVEAVEVYYASEDPLTLSTATVIVVYDLEGEALENFQVVLEPVETEEELSWTSATVDIEGTNEFTLGSFSGFVPGTYEMSFVDTQTGDTYHCPQIVAVDEDEVDEVDVEVPERVEFKADPDDPESATEVEVVYSSTQVEATVSITYRDSEDETTYEESWTYPQFSCTVESDAIDELNATLKADYDETLAATKAWTSDSEDAQCLTYRAVVVYLEGSIASVRIETYYTLWGAHGWSDVRGAVYDLDTGAQLSVETVSGLSSSTLRTTATSAIYAYLETDPSDILDDEELEEMISEIVADSTRYYLCAEGLVVATQPYELGSYAYGGKQIVVIAASDDVSVGTDVSSVYSGL